MKYSCILFDFDGTLAHSDDALFSTVNDTLLHHGHEPITRDVFNGYIGKKMRDLYSKYAKDNQILIKKMRDTHVHVQKRHLSKYKLFHGVIPTLHTIKKSGCKLGIVTTANKVKILELKKSMAFFQLFDVCITAEDVENVKPHKEPIEKAISMLGCKKARSLMVGDTDADVEAAKNADIDSAGVTYSTFGMKIKEYNPTYIIDKFEDLLNIIS